MRTVVFLELTICRRPILFEHNCTVQISFTEENVLVSIGRPLVKLKLLLLLLLICVLGCINISGHWCTYDMICDDYDGRSYLGMVGA